jgi:hypothetical protein
MNNTDDMRNYADFDDFITQLGACLIEDEGVVKLAKGTRPDWLRPLLEFVHRRSMPDEYIMECVWNICGQHAHAVTQREEGVKDAIHENVADGMTQEDAQDVVGEGEDIDFRSVVTDAADEYVRINTATLSLNRRWLMWRDGSAHWKYLDEALALTNVALFKSLIEEGMKIQCDAVGERIQEFYDEVLTQASSIPKADQPQSHEAANHAAT